MEEGEGGSEGRIEEGRRGREREGEREYVSQEVTESILIGSTPTLCMNCRSSSIVERQREQYTQGY